VLRYTTDSPQGCSLLGYCERLSRTELDYTEPSSVRELPCGEIREIHEKVAR
jgi:hypothetical protein